MVSIFAVLSGVGVELLLVSATCGSVAEPGRVERIPAPADGVGLPVKIIRDLDYAEPDPKQPDKRRLDLYLPDDAQLFKSGVPVLFFVHGGSWLFGDRSGLIVPRGPDGGYNHLGRAFARHGVAVVVVSYRLSPGVKHPEHIRDVAAAFAWTKKHIAEHGGRSDQIFVSGHSAGGHLAALLANDPQWLKAHELSPTADIAGVILISGVYRILNNRLFDLMFPRGKAARDDASPIEQVRRHQESGPPTLLLYAQRDLVLLPEIAEEYARELKNRKTEVLTVRVANRDHNGMVLMIGRPDDPTTAEILSFIRCTSGGQQPAPRQTAAVVPTTSTMAPSLHPIQGR